MLEDEAVALLQQGDVAGADALLRTAGHKWRLAAPIWRPLVKRKRGSAAPKRGGADAGAADSRLHVYDGVLPAGLFTQLQQALSPGSPFWSEHSYPTDSFFSYTMQPPPPTTKAGQGGQAAGLLQQAAAAIRPLVVKAFGSFTPGAVEWWAHCRQGADAGHQMHFDLDEDALLAEGEVACPAVSTVFYLTGPGGSPTVVADDSIDAGPDGGGAGATQAWRCPPAPNRLLAFRGSLLHGVPPVLPVPPSSDGPDAFRVTLMMGWWPKGRVPRSGPTPRCRKGKISTEDLGPNMEPPTTGPAAGTARRGQKKRGGCTWPHLLLEPQPVAGAKKRKTGAASASAPARNRACIGHLVKCWEPVSAPPRSEAKKRKRGSNAGTGSRSRHGEEYVGKFFVPSPGAIRAEVQAVCDHRQQAEMLDEEPVVEWVSLEELKRLRAGGS